MNDLYRHKKRGSLYNTLFEGTLQVEEGTILKDGDSLLAYVDEDGRHWLRTPSEFHDGRFESLPPKNGQIRYRTILTNMVGGLAFGSFGLVDDNQSLITVTIGRENA